MNDTEKENIERLLAHVGVRGVCKACGRAIWWVKSKAGKNMPITNEAKNHFADCEQAELFRGRP